MTSPIGHDGERIVGSARAGGAARNLQLDGLRGCAALGVAFYHSILFLDPTLIRRVLEPSLSDVPGSQDRVTKAFLAIFNGEAAVTVFFVLSGAVLFESLRRQERSGVALATGFTTQRFFRIYPALLCCLLACAAVFRLFGVGRDLSGLGENLVLYDFPLHGASWTLQIEFLAIPLLLLSFSAYRVMGVWGIVAAFVLFKLALRTPPVIDHFDLLRRSLLCFTLGMLVTQAPGSWLARSIPASAVPAIIVAMLSARHVIADRRLSEIVLQVSAALLVGQLYHGRAGRLQSLLRHPWSTELGRLSYSFYLYNVLVLETLGTLLLRYTGASQHPLPVGLILGVVVSMLSIPIAHLSERFVEQPCIALGRRLVAWVGRRRRNGWKADTLPTSRSHASPTAASALVATSTIAGDGGSQDTPRPTLGRAGRMGQ